MALVSRLVAIEPWKGLYAPVPAAGIITAS